MPSISPGPHRRYNPLLDEWVLCSPQRLSRPWQGRVESAAIPNLRDFDPDCYLCPGNERAGGKRNPPYTTTYAFDNDFAALADDPPPVELDEGELFRAEPAPGVCRVLCFSPRHDLTLARMTTPDIRRVIGAWSDEVAQLGGRDDIQYVQVFENRGELMGCSNPHPHGQVWATGYIPLIPGRKLEAQRRYLAKHDNDLLGDYLARELVLGERVVCENADWVALVPFWAVWPFETMLLPKRRVGSLTALSDAEKDSLADIIRRLGIRYDNLFECPFPYSMGWHASPTDGQEHAYSRLHATYLPPLLRSATVRKFLVGYELTAEPQRDITAEGAAARLRALEETHYLERAL